VEKKDNPVVGGGDEIRNRSWKGRKPREKGSGGRKPNLGLLLNPLRGHIRFERGGAKGQEGVKKKGTSGRNAARKIHSPGKNTRGERQRKEKGWLKEKGEL